MQRPDDRVPISRPPTSYTRSSGSSDVSGSQKQLACFYCRATKIRCIPSEEGTEGSACIRCVRLKQPCERPSPKKGGRPKGSRNQQSSLERAFKVIEREMNASGKRPRTDNYDPESNQGENNTNNYQVLEDRSRPVIRQIGGGGTGPSYPPRSSSSDTTQSIFATLFPTGPAGQLSSISTSPSRPNIAPVGSGPGPGPAGPATDPSTLAPEQSPATRSGASWNENDHEQAEEGGLSNAVGLLAEAAAEEASGLSGNDGLVDATDILPALPLQYTLMDTLRSLLTEAQPDSTLGQAGVDLDYLAEGLHAMTASDAKNRLSAEDKDFFKPPSKQINRDIGPAYDPIDLALLTEREASAFFTSYFLRLHPMLPVLDPAIHTLEFVRSRSAFLFSAICAHGGSLTSGAGEATKRLRIHTQRQLELISRRGFASVEIVQAFLIWTSWLPSTEPFQEERLWHETKYAINMAVELNLTKPLPADPHQRATDPALDACLVGIDRSRWDLVERIARNRERLWLHLFLWDSSLSLAFGKGTRFMQNDLIRNESWCFHQVATREDRITTASAVLRRRLGALSDHIRSEVFTHVSGSTAWVAPKVDEVLQTWYNQWMPICENSAYLELVYRHTRTWTLSYALQLLSVRAQDVEALSRDCFEAAVSGCQHVCDGLRASRHLWGFPNTMGPMLSFQALIALRLFPSPSTAPPGERFGTKGRLLGLLAQLARLLEQVGSTPTHRLGTAAVYGRHLQVYIRRRVIALCMSHHQRETSGIPTTASDDIRLLQRFPFTNGPSPLEQILPFTEDNPSLFEGDSTLNFLDTTASWTDDFFRIFGGQEAS